ncbi:phage head-tail connector protein [Eubacterium sp.]|uniref:phage head-tail connector protein n=1 Tax=Eubacterium sp. TaxID=142586 RepID=UPI002FC75B79
MLEKIKLLLGITDNDLDTKLTLIVDSVTARLKLLLGGLNPPSELDHIIIEVAIIRFNRIGSEGMSAQSVEGESNTYQDNDFSGFADEIEAFKASQNNTKLGVIRFL